MIFFAHVITGAYPVTGETLGRSDAVVMALENNPVVAAAKNEWDAALARVTQEQAFPDPEFEVEFEGLPNGMRLRDYGERNIGFVQQLESPLKWLYRVNAAKRSAEATKLETYEAAVLEVSSNVQRAYDRILANRKILEYEELNLLLIEEFCEKASVRFKAGDVSQLEVLRAEVARGRSKNRVSRARSKRAVSEAELNALLARDSDVPHELSGELTYDRIDFDESELKRMALLHRPDFRGAVLNVESLKAHKSTIKASLFPDLAVGMFRQTISEPTGREHYWRIGVALELPLWGLSRQRGSIREAGAEIRQAESRQASLRSTILLEVETAIHEFIAAQEQMELFNERVLSLAEKTHETALRSYEEGKATYLELMDARKALIETKIEYTETLFSYRSAVIELERSIGKIFDVRVQ